MATASAQEQYAQHESVPAWEEQAEAFHDYVTGADGDNEQQTRIRGVGYLRQYGDEIVDGMEGCAEWTEDGRVAYWKKSRPKTSQIRRNIADPSIGADQLGEALDALAGVQTYLDQDHRYIEKVDTSREASWDVTETDFDALRQFVDSCSLYTPEEEQWLVEWATARERWQRDVDGSDDPVTFTNVKETVEDRFGYEFPHIDYDSGSGPVSYRPHHWIRKRGKESDNITYENNGNGDTVTDVQLVDREDWENPWDD